MSDKNIVKSGILVCAVIMVTPVLIGGVTAIVGTLVTGVGNIVLKVVYQKKIIKGLKDGSIEVINGEYCEKVIENVEEA